MVVGVRFKHVKVQSIGSKLHIPETSPCDNGSSDGIPNMSHAMINAEPRWLYFRHVRRSAAYTIPLALVPRAFRATTSESVNPSELKRESDTAATCPLEVLDSDYHRG